MLYVGVSLPVTSKWTKLNIILTSCWSGANVTVAEIAVITNQKFYDS